MLLTVGRYDEATPETTESYQSLIPGSELIIFEQRAHTTSLDEAESYIEAVRDFLRKVEDQ